MTKTHPLPRIAYLTGEYTKVSHTFILREVEALRSLGATVDTCSIRKTPSEHHRGPSEKEAARTTFYVIAAAKQPGAIFRAFGAALRRPKRLMRATALAWRTSPAGLRSRLWQGFYLVEAIVLAHHLKALGTEHLHNHFGDSSCSVAMLTSELSGIPFSYTMHGPAIFFEPRIWRIDEKIARARFVACISHFCRSQGMIFADPAHWSKMRIIHCGIDPDRYAQVSRDTPGKRIVFVGRLAAVKGVLVLIEAFARIAREHPDATLTLVGDGSERKSIKARIRALGCESRVRMTGYLNQDEVADELGRADIFALPSFAEGVPVVLMEAMAARLPVIATRIAGIGELVEDGVSGRTVPPGDVDAFAKALETLLSTDPETRADMGEVGRLRVDAAFNGRTEAEKLLRLFVKGPEAGL